MKVSALGFGGAEIGFEKAPVDTVARVLGDALDAGLNVIDTAECYLQSEELIGRAMASRRGEFLLFTKCGHPEGPYAEVSANPLVIEAYMGTAETALQGAH